MRRIKRTELKEGLRVLCQYTQSNSWYGKTCTVGKPFIDSGRTIGYYVCRDGHNDTDEWWEMHHFEAFFYHLETPEEKDKRELYEFFSKPVDGCCICNIPIGSGLCRYHP